MRRLFTALIGAVVISLGPLAVIGYADASPQPSPARSASPSPTRTPSTSSPSPTATASASPSAAPSPSPVPSASPELLLPSATATPAAIDVTRLVTASSLSALVDARTRLAQSELAALQDRLAAVQADREAAVADLVAYDTLLDHRGAVRDRLLRDGLRVAALGGAGTAHLDGEELDAATDQLAFANALAAREDRLAADEADLATTIESVAAKRAELAKLDAQARTLTSAADAGTAQISVLRALADDASAAANAIAELTKGASGDAKQASWIWPVSGAVSQGFGPSALTVEPPTVYHGIAFAHFHDGVDIAAPLGAAVVAAAPGRVTFVGHLPDGAMVVVIAHDDGLVSLSAHLDDAFSPPPVHVGDHVAAGQVVGYVGVTGITTGPHLHFSVHDANGPVDPLVILAAR